MRYMILVKAFSIFLYLSGCGPEAPPLRSKKIESSSLNKNAKLDKPRTEACKHNFSADRNANCKNSNISTTTNQKV